MVIVVASPLATTSYGVYKDNVAQDRAASATKQWLQGSGYRYVSAQVQQNATLRVVATGGGTLPGKDVLRALLAGHVCGLAVHVHAVPSEAFEFPTN